MLGKQAFFICTDKTSAHAKFMSRIVEHFVSYTTAEDEYLMCNHTRSPENFSTVPDFETGACL